MIITDFKIKAYQGPVVVIFDRYVGGNVAIKLRSDVDGPIATASVNPAGNVKLEEGLVAIKEWSENEGITDELIRAGVIELQAVRFINQGFVVIGVYRLTKRALERIRVIDGGL